MSQPQLIRKHVWTSLHRGLHWLIGLTTINLIATAWLIDSAPYLQDFAHDWHLINGNLLLVGIVLRIFFLILGKDNLKWQALLPDSNHRTHAIAMLKFYVTLGRSPLPRWYAHNPLWKPIYAIALALIMTQTFTGVMMEISDATSVYNLIIHQNLAVILTVFTVAHIVTVIFHDVKGEGSDVSSMLNGHRLYSVEQPEKKDNLHRFDIKDLLNK